MSVATGLGMLFFAVLGTTVLLTVPDSGENGTTQSATSAEESRADGQGGQDGRDGRDGQEAQQRTRTAALEEAERSDQAREKAELKRAQAQDRRTRQTEAAHTAQKEREAQQEKKAREKAAAKKAAAKDQDASEKKDGPAGGAGGATPKESKLIALLNERRQSMGLNPVEESTELAAEAKKCSTANLAKDGLEHCGHEVLFQGGKNTTPEAMLEAWFNSPGHKTALTYAGSTKAGGAIVKDASGKLVSAINIDY